jgi:hypothetical protein
MSEQLMTEAETNNNADASQSSADGVTQQAAENAANEQSIEQRAGEALYNDTAEKTQQETASEQDQQSQGEDNAGENDANEDSQTLGAPESYDLGKINDVEMNADLIDAFADVAKELDLSQAAAEKMLSKMQPALEARSQAVLAEVREQWFEAASTDKEYGGDNLQENLQVAKKALDSLATPELQNLLLESGLGNHPEIVRVFYRAGKAISEDSYVGSQQSSQSNNNGPRDFNGLAAALYSNQQN